ncbi:MAG: DMT family transporter, partial [Desulfobulbaceae bacterium]|nr:DMT family transporter [Desulfobulbaceae bacterium]
MSRPTHDPTPYNTIILAITACLLWSTAFVGVKIGLRYSTPLSFAGTRFMLAGLLLTPLWVSQANIFSLIRHDIKIILLLALFQTFLLYGLFYIGITMLSGALAAIIIGASPLTSALTAHFFLANEPMTRSKTMSLGVGVIGVCFISISRLPWASPEGLREFCGIILLLLSTVFSAYGNILIIKRKSKLGSIPLNSLQIFIGGLLLFIVSIPLEGMPTIDIPWLYYG